MTAPFILGNPLDWLLAPDEWRPLRIALAASVRHRRLALGVAARAAATTSSRG